MKPYPLRILLFALLCFTGFYGNAQSWNWVSHNNSDYRRYYINVVTDHDGYIYASGNDSLGFVLTKYKPNGIKIWSKTDTTTEIEKLSIDSAGYLYITAGAGSFTGGTLINTAKLDSAGNRLWTKGIFTQLSPVDGPTGVLFAGATDSAGNSYMSGSFKASSYLTQFDTIALGNLAPNNYFLAKYNSAGKIQWLKFFNDPVYSIACGPQGSYFLECGTHIQKYAANDTLVWQQSFSGVFNPSMVGIYNKFKSDTQGNLLVLGNKMVKYNSNGTLAWVKAFAGRDFSITSSGNILQTGYFIGNLNFGNGVPNLVSGTTENTLFIAQFSGIDGSALWAKQASTSGSNTGEAILSLPNGNIMVAGNFKANSTFDQHSIIGKGFFVAKLSTTLLGISEKEISTNFKLYPNPAISEVTISNPDFRNASLEILNVAGQRILETNYPAEGNLKIATENWPAGLYIVKVTANGKINNQKLMIQH